MKAEIHPTFYTDAKVVCACGNSWVTGSTQPEIRIDICSNCHPFYTGEQRIVDTAGQVERFMNRLKHYGDHAQAQEKRAVQAQEKRSQMFVNQQLVALDLSDRLFQLLTDSNHVTVGDVLSKIEENDGEALLELEGFGPKSLDEVKEKIAEARAAFEASANN